MPRTKCFWIKERFNPQLPVYYELCGQLSNAAAKRKTRTTYGENVMHRYDTEEDYNKAVDELRKSDAKIVN